MHEERLTRRPFEAVSFSLFLPLASGAPCNSQHFGSVRRQSPRCGLSTRLRRLVKRLRTQVQGRGSSLKDEPGTSPAQWRELVEEFEDRADGKYAAAEGKDPPRPPPGIVPGQLNAAQYDMLPVVENAAMVAVTLVLWFLGRIWRMDALIMLLYPLPTMYIAARYGLEDADRTNVVIAFMIFTMMGPVYAVLFVCNTGLLTATYSRALWWRWPFRWALLAGAAAKGIGLALQLGVVSSVLRHNAWQIVGIQVTTMVTNIGRLFNRLSGRTVFGAPTLKQVQVAIVVVIALHSLYHVFFTQVMSAIMFQRLAEKKQLARVPSRVPGVEWILKKAQEPKSNRR